MITRLRWADLGETFDGPHATPTRRSEGPYFLNIASLRSGRLDLTTSDHVAPDDFVKWTKRVTPRAGDLLFSYETRLGEAALMPEGIEACLGRRMALLRPNRAVVDPRFLLYFYLSPDFQRTIEERTIHGATVPRILLSDMPRWPVEVPSLDEQRAIAEVLGALDNKIAANSRLTDTSRSLAKAEWERANNHTVEQVRLRDVATLNYGKSLPAKRRVAGGVQVVGSGGVTGTHNQALVAEAGIVVGRKGTAGAVHWLHGPHFPIDTTFFVTPTAGLTSHFLYYELTSMRLTEMNSDSAVPGLNREEAYAAPVRHPDQSSLRRFNEVVPVLFDLVAQVEAESLSLATTRDALLPLLMSGKVTVTDAETIVEEAL